MTGLHSPDITFQYKTCLKSCVWAMNLILLWYVILSFFIISHLILSSFIWFVISYLVFHHILPHRIKPKTRFPQRFIKHMCKVFFCGISIKALIVGLSSPEHKASYDKIVEPAYSNGIYIYIFVYTYIYIYIHTHTHIYIYK